MATKNLSTIVETQEQVQIALLESSLSEIIRESETYAYRMEERLSGLDLMMESVGWTDISGVQDSGPSLDQLKKRSAQIRSAMALNPHVKRGSELLSSRVGSDPIKYANVPGLDGSQVGRGKVDVGKRIKDPYNQRYVFGAAARDERQRALYSDGLYLLLGDDRTKRLAPIPIWEITADYRNPDNSGEIWAYRRAWTRWNNDLSADEEMVRWYYTDLFKSEQRGGIMVNGKLETVDTEKTIIDGHVNTQSGWAYGFPDAGCIIEWARMYSEFMKSGKKMTDAMAQLWAQYKPTSASNGVAAGIRLGDSTGAGGTSIASGDLTPLSTAGKAYDFKAGTQLLAIVAAGIGVSVVALSSSPGDAGASYGAAETLSLPERLLTERRRMWDADFEVRILRYLGAQDAEAAYPALFDAAEMYRAKQSAALDQNSGLFPPEVLQAKYQAAEGSSQSFPIPAGWLQANNEKSLPRNDIDADGVAPTAAGPGQGQSTGAGSNAGQSTDTRTDLISR